MTMRVIVTTLVMVVGALLASAQDLKGARYAVERMSAASSSSGKQESKTGKAIAEFMQVRDSLSPEEAGSRWVELLVLAMSEESSQVSSGYGVSRIRTSAFYALPGPESWPTIHATVWDPAFKLPSPDFLSNLKLVSAILVGDVEDQTKAIEDLVLTSDGQLKRGSGYNLELYREWSAAAGVKRHIKNSLILYAQRSGIGRLPAEILLLDEADRDETARAIYSNAQGTITRPVGNPELIALHDKYSSLLGAPVQKTEWAKLSEFGMRREFEEYCTEQGSFKTVLQDRVLPVAGNMSQTMRTDKGTALTYYIYNLAIDGFESDAKQLMDSRPYTSQEWFHSRSYFTPDLSADQFEKLLRFQAWVLMKHPSYSTWTVFERTANQAKKPKLLVETGLALIGEEAVDPNTKWFVMTSVGKALLADDQVDEAIDLYLQAIEFKRTAGSSLRGQNEAAAKLLTLARLLGRDDLAQAAIESLNSEQSYYYGGYESTIVRYYVETGQLAKAEEKLIESMTASLSNRDMVRYTLSSGNALLADLLHVYVVSERFEDAIYLLEESPHWPWEDVAQSSLGTTSTVVLDTARALAGTGRTDEATKIVIDVLYREPTNDDAYKLYLDLKGEGAVELFDQLFALDPYEERPLIWKAQALLDSGDAAGAERIARQAISIDPTDGETGGGRRLLVFTVLAEALRKIGDNDQARIYVDAISAVRLAELADQFETVGLKSRAIALYSEALNLFADAYCIEARLAIQLTEAGRPDEAAMHYRRAFELMPDSFGYVETHCFGCDGLFDSEEASSIAETVLLQLFDETPDKPQVPYLLGAVYENKRDYASAVKYYEAAVKIDARYLNAWKELLSMYRLAGGSQESMTEAAVMIVRLDPFGRHGSSSASSNPGLSPEFLWEIGAAVEKQLPKPAKTLFELTASKKARAESMIRDDYAMAYASNRLPRTAASYVMQHMLISYALQVYGQYGLGIME